MAYTRVRVDIDDLLLDLDRDDMDRVVDFLIDENIISTDKIYLNGNNINDYIFSKKLNNLLSKRHLMSIEDEEIIEQLSKKYS